MRRLSLAFALLLATGASADQSFDPKPWLADLDEMRAALETRYANIEWLVTDRGADLDEYFARTRKRIAYAQDDGDARAAFDKLIRRIGDGHIDLEWPQVPIEETVNVPVDNCAAYDVRKAGTALASQMPGYEALPGDVFAAGVVHIANRRLGILRIGIFSPEGMPSLCSAALAELKIASDAPCRDDCRLRIADAAERKMNESFVAALDALNAAHADALLIDLTGNGGGSEWAEAAVRMVTSLRLKSERMAFTRGAQWTMEFAEAESDLREAAKSAPRQDRAFLLDLADQAKAKRAIAETPCAKPGCRLGEGFYASGFIDAADPETLAGKPWAARVFTPMKLGYREGIWHGPLFVLVDQETWSAAEEFAAILQDNHAALILGEPTGGAGCGHTDYSEPVTFSHSGAKLSLPDCARLRADGSNEVRGIVPDVPLPWGRHDGLALRARLLAAKLPALLAK
jgi:hypothetical protein